MPVAAATTQLPAKPLPSSLLASLMDLHGCHAALRSSPHSPRRPTRPSGRLVCSAVRLGNEPGVVWELRSHRLCTENLHSVRVSASNIELQHSVRHLQTDLGPSQVHVPKACVPSLAPPWSAGPMGGSASWEVHRSLRGHSRKHCGTLACLLLAS